MTMHDDDFDSDAVFFGIPSDSPALPFALDDATTDSDESPIDGTDFQHDEGDHDDHESGRIGYGRSSEGNYEESGDDIRASVPWQGRDVSDRLVDEQRAIDEATSAGDRHIGRVADIRSGGDPAGATGGSGSGAQRVADSIRDAQQRLRESRSRDSSTRVGAPERRPIPDGAITNVSTLRNLEQIIVPESDPVIKRHYERSTLSTAPTFQRTNFEATIVGLKANTSGEWIISFKVAPQHKAEVMDLAGAYGLALIMNVERRRRGSNE